MTPSIDGPIRSGQHGAGSGERCALEWAAYLAGEPHSDHPTCVCPVIAEFVSSWNDALPDDATRARLLGPLIPELLGTRANREVEVRRSYMALDWLVRECTPAWLDAAGLGPHAARLRGLGKIVNGASAAASDAATAARAAARAAATAAAWDALTPTVERLQVSAVALVRRMIGASEERGGEG